MQVRMSPASSPPPTASKAIVAPVATSASVMSSRKLGADMSTTCAAPMSLSTCVSPGLSFSLTTFTSGMPSFRQIRFSMRPRLDAAAVSTNALCPSLRIVSVIPSAARGLTNHAAACSGTMPSGIGWHAAACTVRYWDHISPPMTPTTFPRRAWAWGDEPALTTTPAPSLPTDNDLPNRPSRAPIFAAGILAERTGPGSC
mmetsp:Transcript_31942/g.91667  ORF Transcript_31942/g.91667 Transcript_31942/m.91667 type:complete len:200 (-) Transcript_31942:250-849(-)